MLKITLNVSTVFDVPSGSNVNKHLFEDAINNHFKKELKEYSKIEEDLKDYCTLYLNYAVSLRQEILDQTGLPEVKPGDSSPSWINANELAFYIFQSQLTFVQFHFEKKVGQNGLYNLMQAYGSSSIAQGTESEIDKIIEVSNSIIKNTDKIRDMKILAQDTLIRFREIESTLEKIKLKNKFYGKCDYI